MTILKEVVAELIGMFVTERRLTIAVLTVVIIAAVADFAGFDPLVGGTALLFGCLVLLVESVCRSARAGVS
jgi:hypothetical protein